MINDHMRRGKRLDPKKFDERFAALVDQVQTLLVRFLYNTVSQCEQRPESSLYRRQQLIDCCLKNLADGAPNLD